MTAMPLAPADSANADISSLAATLPAGERAALVHDLIATINKLTSIEQHDDACAVVRQMTQILPAGGHGWKTLAYDRLRRGDLPGSRDLLRQAALLLPPDPQLATHLAAAEAMFAAGAASRAGQHEEAIRQFETVLAAYPHYQDANHEIAMALLALGRPLEAPPRLETPLGINPNNGQYRANYVDTLLQGPVADQLINLTSRGGYSIKRVTQEDTPPPQPQSHAEPKPATSKKKSPTLKQLEALALPYNDRKFVVAEKNARAFLERFPSHAMGTKVLAVVLNSLGKLDAARDLSDEAYALNPEDADVVHTYTATLKAAAEHHATLAVCQKLVESYGSDATTEKPRAHFAHWRSINLFNHSNGVLASAQPALSIEKAEYKQRLDMRRRALGDRVRRADSPSRRTGPRQRNNSPSCCAIAASSTRPTHAAAPIRKHSCAEPVPAFIHNGPWSDAKMDRNELGVFPRLRQAADRQGRSAPAVRASQPDPDPLHRDFPD